MNFKDLIRNYVNENYVLFIRKKQENKSHVDIVWYYLIFQQVISLIHNCMIFFFSFFHSCSKREVNKKVLKVPSIEQKVSPFYFWIIFDVHQPSFNLYTCWMTPANVWDLFEAMCFWKPGWINKIFSFLYKNTWI